MKPKIKALIYFLIGLSIVICGTSLGIIPNNVPFILHPSPYICLLGCLLIFKSAMILTDPSLKEQKDKQT